MSDDISFNQVRYLLSAPTIKQCPDDVGKEVAFAGRSNAGKSSAINTLTNNSKLARTSKTPGRTQLLNFFSLTEDLRLVDLPGYGFAKNKGYGTPQHLEALQRLGPCAIHRRSFAPVSEGLGIEQNDLF